MNSRFLDTLDSLSRVYGNPYFHNGNIALFNGDAMVMDSIDDCFSDLTITSPPYNIGKEYEEIKPIDEYVKWTERWVNKVHKVTVPSGALLLNLGYIRLDSVGRAIPISYLVWDKIRFYLNQEIVWNYGAGVACKNYLSPRNEKLLWYVKNSTEYTFNLDDIRDPNVKYPNSKRNGKLRVNRLGKNPSDVWEIAKVTTGKNRQSKERTTHPAQFPVDLVDRAVKGFSNASDIVFDPFSGSGSTLMSCIQNNRFGIGIEINRDYCEISKKRVLDYLYGINSNKLF